MKRFPLPIPFGWFQVGDQTLPGDGEVVARRYFGRDVVLWRDDDGHAHVHDAYCPHLGAHLGVGGTVADNCLTCPFHGWKFAGDGSVTEIPYSEKLNRKARLRTYPVVEKAGLVFAWYHPTDEPPQWELPSLDEVGTTYSTFDPNTFDVYTHPQEMVENVWDPAHFKFVHKTEQVATVVEESFDGPVSLMRSRQSYITPKGTLEGTLDVYQYGPGVQLVRFTGVADVILMSNTAPIDDEHTAAFFNTAVRQPASDAALRFANMLKHTALDDKPIFESKRYTEVPALSDGDGPILRYRKWYRQFYVDAELAAAQAAWTQHRYVASDSATRGIPMPGGTSHTEPGPLNSPKATP